MLASKFPHGRFEHVYIKGHKPYITIDLRMSGISAYASNGNIELRGVISKIRDIIQRRKQLNLHLGWLFSALTYIAVTVDTWQLMSKEYVTGMLLIFLSLVSIPISVRYTMKNTVVVRSQPRNLVKNYFERKKMILLLQLFQQYLVEYWRI